MLPAATKPAHRSLRWWYALSPPTRLAILGFSIGWGLPSIVFRWLGWYATYWEILKWASGQALNDSWRPIKSALDYLDAHGASGLYEATYHQSDHQFLYSPLSIVLYKATSILPFMDWRSTASMNAVSWWFIPATTLLVGGIFCSNRSILSQNEESISNFEFSVRYVVAMVLSFTFFPLMLPYTLGNIQTWINSGLVASLLLFIHGGRFSVGVVIGLCCTIKPSWSLIVLWFLLRREYQAVLGMLVVGFGLASVSLVMFGLSVHLEYLQLLRVLSTRGESYFSNQSLNGLLNRMFFLGNNLEWDGSHTLLKYDAWVHAASSITSLLLIGACVIPWRQGDRRGTTAGFCIALMTFLLASPVAYRHYYAVLLPIMLITLIAISYRRPQLRWLQLLLAVAYIASANTISGVDYLAPTMFNFLQSYLYFAGLLVLGLLYYLFPPFLERADGDCPLRS